MERKEKAAYVNAAIQDESIREKVSEKIKESRKMAVSLLSCLKGDE